MKTYLGVCSALLAIILVSLCFVQIRRSLNERPALVDNPVVNSVNPVDNPTPVVYRETVYLPAPTIVLPTSEKPTPISTPPSQQLILDKPISTPTPCPRGTGAWGNCIQPKQQRCIYHPIARQVVCEQ